MRWLCALFIIVAPLVLLDAHCSARDARHGFVGVGEMLAAAKPAEIAAASRGARNGELVKVSGRAKASRHVAFPAFRGDAPLVYYTATLFHRHDDGDDTVTDAIKRWNDSALEVAEGSDAWVAVEAANVWFFSATAHDIELSVRRDGVFGGGGVVERNGLVVPVKLKGSDRFWLEGRSIDPGTPLFVVGVLDQRGNDVVLRAPDAGKAIVSTRDEATTRAYLSAQVDGKTFRARLYLALVPVAVLLGVLGLFYFKDD